MRNNIGYSCLLKQCNSVRAKTNGKNKQVREFHWISYASDQMKKYQLYFSGVCLLSVLLHWRKYWIKFSPSFSSFTISFGQKNGNVRKGHLCIRVSKSWRPCMKISMNLFYICSKLEKKLWKKDINRNSNTFWTHWIQMISTLKSHVIVCNNKIGIFIAVVKVDTMFS